ncbi:MAG: DUF3311 domain-containing protein [Thermoplasmatales archaeon]
MSTGEVVSDEISLEVKGTSAQKAAVAILLLIPIVVFAITPLYNFSGPKLFGITFFYWFETLWLFVSAAFFTAAAYLLNKMESGK